jgi:hypothetical protein
MAHPRVADEGDGHQIWRVAANVLNKQSWTADKGWSSSLGVGEGLTTPRRKIPACYETLGPWDLQALMNKLTKLRVPQKANFLTG